MPQSLKKLPHFPGVAGPVVVIVMDGYGLSKTEAGNAIAGRTQVRLQLGL